MKEGKELERERERRVECICIITRMCISCGSVSKFLPPPPPSIMHYRQVAVN